MQILVVEDEAKVQRAVAKALKGAGFSVDAALDGEDAWFRAGTQSYAAIVLDLGLPGLDGLSVLKRLRSEGVATPVLVLSARGSWSERVAGIKAGADDYLPKPFEMEELIARVEALIRRSTGTVAEKLGAGGLELDPLSATVTVNGQAVDLTQMEYRLLHHLVVNRGKIITASELADDIYSHNHERDTNAVEVLIGRLRRKIGRDYVGTRRGFGYIFPGREMP